MVNKYSEMMTLKHLKEELMSSCHRGEKMKTLATFKPVVISQASGKVAWASGLVVMTSRLQRGDRLFNSGLAHSSFIFIYFKVNNINNFITKGRD